MGANVPYGMGRAPILMSPDIYRPFWPFPRHSSLGLMSGVRLCWPGFGAGFVRIPMEKPPNRLVPRGGVESSETDPMPQMDRAQRENHESAFKIENGFLGAKL